MAKRERTAKQHDGGKWFAPPSGGYSGVGPEGEVVARKGLPPKTPATAPGLRRLKDEEARAAT